MGWEDKLKRNIKSIDELKRYVKLSKKEEALLGDVIKIHPMNITRYYLSLINKNDEKDPLRKLVVPSLEELIEEGDYDTSGERQNTKRKGLQHKYKSTALVLATNRCASYCRFCFRKRFVGVSKREIVKRLNNSAGYIRKHKEINNVLISGGDPLILRTEVINGFLKELSNISHLKFIRFGTRVPLVFPDRILEDNSLLDVLRKYSKKDKRIYIVTHFNHPREITDKSIAAVDKLMGSKVIINNQTVLMKSVNDNEDVLSELQENLVGIGVNPYYVFQCRPIKRVKRHFQIPIYKGYKVVEGAKKRLDGHSKRFRYVMSHKTGKIEIVGMDKEFFYFKYHQARYLKDIGRFFKRKIDKEAAWLDELK